MNSASRGASCSAAAAGEEAATGSAGGGQVGEGRFKFSPAQLDGGDTAPSSFVRVLHDSILRANGEEAKGREVWE